MGCHRPICWPSLRLGVFGRVCEMFGRKLPYLLGSALFTVASLLCGYAGDLPELVALRALQGIGGGLLGANSMTILVKSVPVAARPRAIGYFTTAQAVGVGLGPIFRGILLDALGWRWILLQAAVPFRKTAAFDAVRPVGPAAHGGLRQQGETYDLDGRRTAGAGTGAGYPGANAGIRWPPRRRQCWRRHGRARFSPVRAVPVRRGKETRWPVVDVALFRKRDFGGRRGRRDPGLCAALRVALFLDVVRLPQGPRQQRAAGRVYASAVIPVMLGLIAPLGIAPQRTLRRRRVGATGMALCLLAILGLVTLRGPSGRWLSVWSRWPCSVWASACSWRPTAMLSPSRPRQAKPCSPQPAALVNLGRVLEAASASRGRFLDAVVAAGGGPWPVDAVGPVFVEAVAGSLLVLAVLPSASPAASLAFRRRSLTTLTTLNSPSSDPAAIFAPSGRRQRGAPCRSRPTRLKRSLTAPLPRRSSLIAGDRGARRRRASQGLPPDGRRGPGLDRRRHHARPARPCCSRPTARSSGTAGRRARRPASNSATAALRLWRRHPAQVA